MTTRETLLAAGLGGFIVLGGVGLFGYVLVVSPLQDKWAQAETVRGENRDKELDLMRVRQQMPRLATAVRRSLPADDDIARQEYEAAIRGLLRDAKVPASATTVTPRGGDERSAPELPRDPLKPNNKRFAYKPFRVEVQLKKVKFAALIDVLKRYYKLNLLHQITRFQVKKADDATSGGGYTLLADKPDLEVTFTTEAVSLYGAEARRSLLPVPLGFAALGGQASLYALGQSPLAARGLTPLQLARVLAEGDRDYSLMLVKDIFHGPPPTPPAPVKPTPPPPKDDTSLFIKLVGAGRNPDGSGTAVIEDVASAQQYLVEVNRDGGKLKPSVTKSYRTTAGGVKSYDPEPELDISESTSSTSMRFRVIGIAENGLVLELKGGKPPRGDGVGKSPERVYHWRLGQPLSRIELVEGEERAKLVAAAGGG